MSNTKLPALPKLSEDQTRKMLDRLGAHCEGMDGDGWDKLVIGETIDAINDQWKAIWADRERQAGKAEGFPARILDTLKDMADRNPKDSRAPWEYADGAPMQDDAEAALRWINAVASLPAPQAVQAGWKLVPVEPTNEMETAAENDYEQRGETFPDWKSKWRAMLAAAPSPDGKAEQAEAPGWRDVIQKALDAWYRYGSERPYDPDIEALEWSDEFKALRALATASIPEAGVPGNEGTWQATGEPTIFDFGHANHRIETTKAEQAEAPSALSIVRLSPLPAPDFSERVYGGHGNEIVNDYFEAHTVREYARQEVYLAEEAWKARATQPTASPEQAEAPSEPKDYKAWGMALLGRAKDEAIERAALDAFNNHFFKCTPSCSVKTWTSAWKKAIAWWTGPVEAATQPTASNDWKEAVLEQLVAHGMDAPLSDTPAKIVKDLIDMAVTQALDPAISATTASNAGDREVTDTWDSNPDGIKPGQDAPVRMDPNTGSFDAPDECMQCGGSGIDPETLGTCPACHGGEEP